MYKLVVVLILPLYFFSQEKLDSIFSDCEFARVISLGNNLTTKKTIAPNGKGKTDEIGIRQKSNFVFEHEHHSAWYQLLIKTSGHLCFDIIPSKPDDDYDFILYNGNSINFCDSLLNYKIKPIRSCISKCDIIQNGKTGLKTLAKKEFIKEGKGDSYVKAIYVSKGDVYYLVLDNVHENGQGHKIKFYFEESVKINGIILDENNKPIIADISFTNPIGDTILLTKSNLDGTYAFEVPLQRNSNYSLNFYNDETFVFSKNLTLKDSLELKNIKTILPHLKKGNQYSIGAINFKAGLTEYLPQAIPSMNNLYRLLKKNKTLKIRIIGHSNGRSMETEKGILEFTNRRAEKIRNYLINKGIEADRIETEGRGDKEMLFKLPGATEAQQILNRRVEILVLEF